MITTLCIWLTKLAVLACHIVGREGSSTPGLIASKLDKKVLWKLKYPKDVVIITGSSGKGSSISMTAHILERAGKKVVWNSQDSNVNTAIMTTILSNTKSFSHKVNADVILLEVDERYVKGLLKPGTVSHFSLTNITRDQPSRNIHPEVIYEKIKESIDDKMHLIINADDPFLNRFKHIHSGDITTYGVSKNKYSLTTTPGYAVDAAYCPLCHTKLRYDAYHYGHLGIYSCPNCEFGRGRVDYEASDVDLNSGKCKINGHEYKLNKNVFFCVYYTLLAYTIASTLGISEEEINDALNVHGIESRRMNSKYTFDGRTIEILEPKNENSLSYIQTLSYVQNIRDEKSVVIGFENVSRRYKYNDLSWLWDINFEMLNDDTIDKIFLFGQFRYDLATRLYYAGIPDDKVILVDDVKNLVSKITECSKGNVYALVGEDIKGSINGMLKEESHEETNN